MAVERRDIELVLRAKDLSTKPFQDVAAAVKGLTGALEEQLQAAQKGDLSLGELRDTMRKLEEAGAALLKQQSLIDLYRKLGDQLDAAKVKAAGAREAFETMKAAQAGSEEVTKKQTKELGALERAADRADKTVARIAANVATQTERLAAAGLAVDNLERHQQELAETAQQTGAAFAAAGAGIDNYSRHIRELQRGREDATKAARAEADATRAAAEALREEAAEADRAAGRRDALAKAEREFDAAREAAARRFRQSELEAVFTPVLDQQDSAAKAKLTAEQEVLRTLREEEALEQRLAARREADRLAELTFQQQRAEAQRRFRQSELEAVFRPVLDAQDAAPKLAAEAAAKATQAQAEATATALADMREEEAATARVAVNLERETRELERFRATQAEILRGFREAEFGRTFAPVIAEMEAQEAAEKKLAAERAAAAATAARDAERAVRDAERQQATFRQLSAELQRAATGMDTLQSSTVRLATADSNFAGTLLGVVDAAKQERETLEGLEQQLARFEAATTNITKAIEGYEVQLAQIGAAQRELVSKAELIDSFKNQQAVVKAANAEWARARETVVMYAKALANPAQANEELARESQQAGVALAAATREMQGQDARLQALARSLKTAGIDTKNLSAEERRLTAVANGLVAANDRLAAGFAKHGRSMKGEGLFGLTPYALQNIGFQLQDIFVQISAGTSVTQTLSQQLPQLFSAIPGAFGAIASRLPIILPLLTAAVAGFGAMSRAMDDIAQKRAFSGMLAASADGANYQAAALVTARRSLIDYGASAEDATTAVREFVEKGIRQDRIEEFGKAAQDAADALGKKLPDVARAMAEGFSGGWQAVKKLNDEFGFLTAPQAEQIRRLYETGEGAKAASLAFETFRAKMGEGAAEARGPWTDAMRAARTALSDLFDWLSRTAPIQLAVAGFARIANAIRDISTAISEVLKQGPAAQLANAEKELTRIRDRMESQRSAGLLRPENRAAFERQIAEQEAKVAALRAPAAPGAPAAAAAALPPGVEGPTNSRRAIDDADYLRRQAAELEGKRQLNKEEAIARAGEEARRKARDANRSAAAQEAAALAAESAERRKIEESEANSLARLTETAQMGRRMSAEERVRAAGDRAQRDAENRSEGNAAEQRAVAERIERAKIAEEQRSAGSSRLSAERELANQLSELRATADRTERVTLEQRLHAIDERYSRIYQSLERFKQLGGSSVGGMSLDQFTAQVEASKQQLRNTETLKDSEERVNLALRERRDIIRDALDQQRAGQISATESFAKQEEATRRLTPKIKEMADEAIRFARALAPSPATNALIARMQRLGNVDAGGAGTDAEARAGARAGIQAQQQEVSRRFAERTAMVETYNKLVEQGAITQLDADARIKAAYEGTNQSIRTSIEELGRVNKAAFDANKISQTEFDATNAKVQELAVSLQYVSPLLKTVQQAFQSAFSQGVVTALDSASQSIAGLIDGTKSWKDVLKDAGKIGLKLVADLIKGIAMAILQFYALRLASAAMQALGLGGGLADGAGMIAGAAATTAASIELGAASGFLVGGATQLGISAGALMAAAEMLIIANSIKAAGVAHEGGIAGSLLRSRPVNPSWFIGAPRYHNGTSGAGLQPNEVPAILQRGEEVLTKSDPRHVLNGGKGAAGGGGGGQLAIRNVLVMDQAMIPEAMSSSQGERVTVANIRKNAGAIKTILGVK